MWASHLHVCWFLYVSFYLEGVNCPFFFSNRRKIETTTWDSLKERQSKMTVTSFVFLCVDTASKFSHLRINPLRSCLPLCWWNEDSQWTKEAPQMPYGVGVRSKARTIWIWPQERKFFSHEARTYCKKKTYTKVIITIFSERFWLSFIAFDEYNKY